MLGSDPLHTRYAAEHTKVMPAIRRHWTTAEVRALMDESRAWPRYELIGGELLVTPAPRGAHQLVVLELAVVLHEYLGRELVGIVVASPADLELRPGTITQPDLFVIPAETRIAGDVLQWDDVKELLLAVEVLSPGSVRTDRSVKRDFYMDVGVAEYWVVDMDARIVERWTPTQETPVIVRDRLTWAPSSAAPLIIDLPALFDRVTAKLGMFKR
jgi:Uma2 family endonuclease